MLFHAIENTAIQNTEMPFFKFSRTIRWKNKLDTGMFAVAHTQIRS